MALAIHASRGYEQINDLSSATGLTVPDHALRAEVVDKDQAVRWRDDGTSPSATVGMPMAVDQPYEFTNDLDVIEFFEQAAGAELNVTYY